MNANFPKKEEKVLKFWTENKIFEKSIEQRRGCPLFSFYDGPPFATGKPHYGHILATTIKDTVLRYWTMKGYYIPRRVGWDCHGLPVENLIEKELGIKNKSGIEEMGIEKFNAACRASVFRCVSDFQKVLKRVGRWANYKGAYATMDNDYIESVWWVFKNLWDMGLVYKDYRVVPFCPRCGTPLSNFEVNQGYKEIEENSVYLKIKIRDDRFKDVYFLVWTTTPWTLPANVGLAINPKADYVEVEENEEKLILAKERVRVLSGDYKTIETFKGKDLLGLEYEPIFHYLEEARVKNIEKAFRVFAADFVTLEEGTGIVHIAPMYGEDDFNLGKREKLPFYHTVGKDGRFKKDIKIFAGKFVKDADPLILEYLKEHGLFYKEEKVKHNYPFCWRCDTPLLYYALETWYIGVAKFKSQLIENNKKIHWVPGYIKEGRFGKWLEGAKDWSFSRSRFWGAPIPIWKCQKCGSYKAIGSVKELETEIKDLHRPFVDRVSLKCDKCGGEMKRIDDVFDCWFESGSMPYAQWHYPFENKELVEKSFPADFIAEGLDQTRGWFYTLHVLATALTLKDVGLGNGKPAFKNVIVNGIILSESGQKLSKRLKNYPDPSLVFDKYGVDSLRYFLLSSTPIGEDYRISEKAIASVLRSIVSTFWNCLVFFETYKEKDFKPKSGFKPRSLLDKWIVSKLNRLNEEIRKWMDLYDITKASRPISEFIDDFSNWYIRRSRSRLQKPLSKGEKEEASQTIYFVLKKLSVLTAPFLIFISEEIFQKLRGEEDKESVHLTDFPEVNEGDIDLKLEEKMEIVRRIVALALKERAEKRIKTRQPLRQLKVRDLEVGLEEELIKLIKGEVNVKEVIFDSKIKNEVELDTKITPNLRKEGQIREIIRYIQAMRKNAGLKPKDEISVQYSGTVSLNRLLSENKAFILEEAKAKDLRPGQRSEGVFIRERLVEFGQEQLWLAIKRI